MRSKDLQTLRKIYEHVDAISVYCKDCISFQNFQSNHMRVDACVFNLMQIGELAKTALSDEVKSQLSSIPWKQIYGMRNRIVHEYAGVELKIVWKQLKMIYPN